MLVIQLIVIYFGNKLNFQTNEIELILVLKKIEEAKQFGTEEFRDSISAGNLFNLVWKLFESTSNILWPYFPGKYFSCKKFTIN